MREYSPSSLPHLLRNGSPLKPMHWKRFTRTRHYKQHPKASEGIKRDEWLAQKVFIETSRKRIIYGIGNRRCLQRKQHYARILDLNEEFDRGSQASLDVHSHEKLLSCDLVTEPEEWGGRGRNQMSDGWSNKTRKKTFMWKNEMVAQ